MKGTYKCGYSVSSTEMPSKCQTTEVGQRQVSLEDLCKINQYVIRNIYCALQYLVTHHRLEKVFCIPWEPPYKYGLYSLISKCLITIQGLIFDIILTCTALDTAGMFDCIASFNSPEEESNKSVHNYQSQGEILFPSSFSQNGRETLPLEVFLYNV